MIRWNMEIQLTSCFQSFPSLWIENVIWSYMGRDRNNCLCPTMWIFTGRYKLWKKQQIRWKCVEICFCQSGELVSVQRRSADTFVSMLFHTMRCKYYVILTFRSSPIQDSVWPKHRSMSDPHKETIRYTITRRGHLLGCYTMLWS